MPVRARSRDEAADDEVGSFLLRRKVHHLTELLFGNRNPVDGADFRRGLRTASYLPTGRDVDSARRHYDIDDVRGEVDEVCILRHDKTPFTCISQVIQIDYTYGLSCNAKDGKKIKRGFFAIPILKNHDFRMLAYVSLLFSSISLHIFFSVSFVDSAQGFGNFV